MTTRDLQTFGTGLLLSLGLHAVFAEALEHAPRDTREMREVIEFDVRQKAPPPPPAPAPPPPPEPEPPKKPVKLAKKAPPPPDLLPPKPDQPPPPDPKPVPRVFGTKLSGETTADGVSVPEGNTLNADPNRPRPKEIPQAPPSTGAPAPPGAPPGFEPVDDSQIASFPEVADEVRAPYPPEAEARQIEGTVQVRVEINADGSVHGARVLKGLGFGLDEAAVKALKKFHFKPARDRAGRSVPSVIVWRYTFRLDR